MPDNLCPERAKLERAVVDAVRDVYAAKPADRGPLRQIERAAVKALQQHLEEHDCERVKSPATVAP